MANIEGQRMAHKFQGDGTQLVVEFHREQYPQTGDQRRAIVLAGGGGDVLRDPLPGHVHTPIEEEEDGHPPKDGGEGRQGGGLFDLQLGTNVAEKRAEQLPSEVIFRLVVDES